ncbi:MAG: MJ0042-type zinc finger domain-containing protein, partial [Arenicellales bacterium]
MIQTQCPHCNIQYHVDQLTIDSFGGFVQCGNCDAKFNVHDVSPSEQAPILDTSYQINEPQLTGPEIDQVELKGEVKTGDKTDSNEVRIEPSFDQDDSAINIQFNKQLDDDELFEPKLDGATSEHVFTQAQTLENEQERFSEPTLDTRSVDDSNVEPDNMTFTEYEFNDEGSENAFIGTSATQKLRSENEADASVETASDSTGLSAAELTDKDEARQVEQHFDGNEAFIVDAHVDQSESSFLEDSSTISLINDDASDVPLSKVSLFFTWLKHLFLFLFWAVAAVALAYLLMKQINEKLYPAYKNH